MSIQKIESILTQKNIGTLINSLNQILKLKSAINDLKILANGKLATGLTKENLILRMNEILQEINIDEVDELLIEQGQFTEEFNSVLCDLSYNNKEIADL